MTLERRIRDALALGAILLTIASTATAGDLVLETSWGSTGSEPGQFEAPTTIDVGPDGAVYVMDRGNSRVQKYTSEGGFLQAWGSPRSSGGEFLNPWGLAVSPLGEVGVCDGDRIHRFSNTGTLLGTVFNPAADLGSGYVLFSLTYDAEGLLYVCADGADQVLKLSPTGEFLAAFGGSGSGPGQFDTPSDVAVADDGEIFVTDARNHRVQVFSPSLEYLREWDTSVPGVTSISEPLSIAVSGDDVFVSDTWLLRFDKLGNLTGTWGLPGTIPTYFAGLALGIATNADRQVFVLDYVYRVLRFGPAPVQTTSTTWGQVKALRR